MLIDAHAHINFNAFKDDAPEVTRRALENGVWMINIGSQSTTSQRAVEMAQKYEKGVYACVGLHPFHLTSTIVDEAEIGVHFKTREEQFNYNFYQTLAQSPKVVGIGETGLDFFYLKNGKIKINETIQRQKEIFLQHIKLAKELDLPLMLHCRGSKENSEDAYWEMVEILETFWGTVPERGLSPRGMIHCFGSNLEIAQQFIDLGFCVGFTGVITFPNASRLQEVVRQLPMDKIIIETDCPYLAPQPVRGKRNEPLYVKYVAEKIAEIKKLLVEEVEKATFENTLRIFNRITNIPPSFHSFQGG